MTIRTKDLQSEAESLFANENALARAFDAWMESEAELIHTHIYESRAEPSAEVRWQKVRPVCCNGRCIETDQVNHV